MATFAKPENALKRAEEFVNVGQKQPALQALHDIITSKRYRAWQKTHEKIMFKYVELCVDMRKGRFAKDGLIQYRNICQQVNVSSLEEVIKHFIQLSTERAEQARSQAHALEDALDVDDLGADKRPEELMLSYISGEMGKEKSDRELVTPWFKFLWETYRTVLEVLKNNSKLETLYAMTAHRAFQFCKQYKRTTEFRRLCDIIRNHLANLNKYKDQRDRPDFTIPETLQLYLDTRVEQLKIATDLELWQEAFRSVEDIHGLMTSVKKSPKPSVMVTYYAKLSEICWVSESYLYHSYAWLNIFNLQKAYNKNLTQKDLQLIASSVMLAALSVTPYDHKHGASHMELENEKERRLRMANLIGFGLDSKREVLSRASLFADLASKGVMNCVSQEVKDLYSLLEHDTFQLDLSSKVHPLLVKISKLGAKLSSASSVPEVQLSRYISAIEKLTTLRVLQQASKMYRTMKIEMLSKIVPFFDFSAVEKISVDAVKHSFIAMKVDHVKSIVLFGNLDIESDCLCGHLSTLASSLDKARNLIYPSTERASKLSHSLFGLADLVEKEHKRLLARKSIIEKRKEEQEHQILQKERDEDRKKREADKIIAQLEIKRREEDRLKRVKEKQILEKKLIDSEELKTFLDQFPKKKGKGPIIEAQHRERQEKEKKLQKLSKTMDHMERAKREAETPLIQQAFDRRLMEEKVIHECEQMKEIQLSKQHHVGDLKEKNRLARMLDNKVIFASKREAEYNDHKSQIIANRKRDREIKRKLLFYLRSEEETRKLEEAERKNKEEAERKARLDEIAERQRQRERESEEGRKIKLDEIAERQRQRERELEEIERRRSGNAEPGKASDPDLATRTSDPPGAPARAPGKFVPSILRGKVPQQQYSSSAPLESDRWWRRDDRPSACTDIWRSGIRRPAPGAPELQNSRRDDCPPAPEPERWGRRASSTSSALPEPQRGTGQNDQRDDHPPVSRDTWRSGDDRKLSNGSAHGSKSSGDDNLKPSNDSADGSKSSSGDADRKPSNGTAGGSKSSSGDRWTSSRQR